MRVRWQSRHYFWLVVTLVILAVVFGRRMMTERDVEPIGPTAEEDVPALTEAEPSFVHKDLPVLETFEGPYHFESVHISDAAGEAGHRLVLTVTSSEDEEPQEVVLAAVAISPEASAAARETVKQHIRDGLSTEPVRLLRLDEPDEFTQRPLAYAARPYDEDDRAAQQAGESPRTSPAFEAEGLPYWLVNREALRETVVRFDGTIAASLDPGHDEQALAMLVLTSTSPLQRGH